MENCEGGAISDIMLAIGSPLNEDQAKEVIAYTLLALEHCHKNGIIHRVLFLLHVFKVLTLVSHAVLCFLSSITGY